MLRICILFAASTTVLTQMVTINELIPKDDLEENRDYLMMKENFLMAAVAPDYVPKAPEKHCKLHWGRYRAVGGNILHRSMIMSRPNISWKGQEGELYTMMLIHTHLRFAKWRYDIYDCWSPWIVGNIPGPCEIDRGQLLWPYNVTYDLRDKWLHKHVAVIYKQKKPIQFTIEDRYTYGGAADFNVSRFVDKYDLGDPEFGNFIFSDMEWGLTPFPDHKETRSIFMTVHWYDTVLPTYRPE